MTVLKSEIRRGAYADSIILMQLQSDLKLLPGVLDAGVVMATPTNLDLLRASDLLPSAVADQAGGDDLVVVVRAETAAAAEEALEQVDALMQRKGAVATGDFRPHSLAAAIKLRPDANWTLISAPGRWAAQIAREALELGRHLFIYSDNVEIEEEIALKRDAAEKGLLVMGPDCGTALINGIGFGFANRVRRGPVGLVCAAGTGLQAIASRVHELGAGISQAIGTGGRDLSADVGGRTARQGLDLLARDPGTQVLVLASKPPEKKVAAQLLAAALEIEKPVVVSFSGWSAPAPQIGNLYFARGLTEAADLAVELAGREQDQRPQVRQRPALTGLVRGLFAGGTLALEAVQGLSPFLAPLYSNLTAPGVAKVPGTTPSRGHTILDLGADELTVGRLHPMLDPQLRLQRLRQEMADPEVSLVLLDVVLGRGTHSDPASELAPAIAECLQRDDLEVVVVLVGTEEDPQNLDSTQEQLVTAGATVYRTVSAAIDHIVPRAIPAVSPLACPVTLEIFEDPVVAINIGLEGFYTDLLDQQVEAVQVDWRPPAGGNEKLVSILERMKS